MDGKLIGSFRAGTRQVMSRLSVIALTGVVLVSGLAAHSVATEFQAGKVTLADLAPSDCLAYASLSGLGDWSDRMDRFALYRLWEEPDVQAFLKEGLQVLPAMIQHHMGASGVELGEITKLFQGRVEVVAGDLTMVAVGNDIMALPGIVLALDVGSRRDEFLGAFDQVIGHLAAPQHVRQGQMEYRGVSIRTFSPPESTRKIPFFDLKICTATLDNLFLVGLNPSYLQRIIDSYKGGGGKTLSSNPSFQRSLAKIGGDPFLSLFVNVQSVRGMVERLIPAEIKQITEDLGIASVQSIYIGSGEEGGAGTDVLYVDTAGPHVGLLNILSLAPCKMKALQYAPENAIVFLSLNLDLNGAKNEIFHLLGKYVPEAIQKAKQGMAHASRQIGLDIEHDVLEALTGEISVCVAMNPGSMIPDVLLAIGVEDSQKFDRLLKHGFGMAGDQLTTHSTDHKGSKFDYVSIPGAPVMPAFRRQDGLFLVTVSPLMMKNILDAAEAGESGGLAKSKDFREALESCGSGPSIFSYADMRNLVSVAYNSVLPWVQGALPPEVPLDMAMLPTSEVITKHLIPDTSAYFADDDGLLMRSRSSFGTSFFLSMIASVVNHFDGVRIECPINLVSGGGSRSYTAERTESESHVASQPPVAKESPRRPETRPEPVAVQKLELKKMLSASKKAMPAVSFDEAMALYQGGRLEESIKAFSSVIDADPDSGRAYFFRGYSHYQLQRYEGFTYDSKKAAEKDFQTETSYYNVACGYSLLGKKGPALKYLALAIENGFSDLEHIEGDSDLDTIRNEEGFRALIKKIN